MKAWQIVSVLLALVLVGAGACNPFGGGDQEETGPQLVEVVRGDLTVSISGSGSIEVAEEAKSSFGVGGRIEKIYVEEGDRVSMGDVLAELDTGDLELALTQSKVTLAKQQLAVSQQEVAITKQQVALAKQEVAVTQAEVVVTQEEVDLKTAIYDLEMTQDLYTWSDIKIAQADVDVAERDLEYALEQLYKYLPLDEQGDYPRIDEEFTKLPGYKVWQERVVHAQSRLNTAKNTLDAMLSGSDTEQVAIKRHSVELAEQSLELAQHSVELARQSLEQEQKSLEQEQKSLEQEQKSLEQEQKSLEVPKLSREQEQQSLEQEQKSLEVTKQALEQAKQSVDQAQKQLDKATLTAPFGGVIADVAVDEGDTVSTTVTIIHLMDLTSMELQVEVDEIDIPVVKPGQKAIIEVDALPEFKLEGEVISIGLLPVVEAGIVSYEVTVGLNASEDSGLKVGMAATVDIITEERSGVLLVPNRVVAQDRQGNPVVGVMIDGQVQERVVVTGISDDTHTEIVEGLQEGDVAVQETRAKPESSGPGFFFGG